MFQHLFNGGKLYHVFDTVKEGNNLFYIDQFTSSHAQEAFEKGNVLLKVDGACCILMKEDGEWKFYERRDNFKGKEETIPLPEGKQLDTYDQGGKEHHYSYLYMSPSFTTGKGNKKNEVGKTIYEAIQNGLYSKLLPDPKLESSPSFISCELVGTKHQANRDHFAFEHGLIPHYEPFLPFKGEKPKSLEEFQALVNEKCFEGLVFIHSDGTRYKLRSDLCRESLWKDTKNETDFKPQLVL